MFGNVFWMIICQRCLAVVLGCIATNFVLNMASQNEIPVIGFIGDLTGAPGTWGVYARIYMGALVGDLFYTTYYFKV